MQNLLNVNATPAKRDFHLPPSRSLTGELGLGLNVVAVKKAQEQLDSMMELVSHGRVLKGAAQAKALKVI